MLRRILNCVPSRDIATDWRIENARESGAMTAAAPLPPSVDLREDWWRVGDQGNSGSCVGWATGDSVLRWHLVRAKRLAKDSPLAVRFLWMAAKETDEFTDRPTTFIEDSGTSIKAALSIARHYGTIQDDLLPFESGVLYQGDDKTLYALAAQLRIASYFNLGHDLDSWRGWLAANGPIATRLDVDKTWDDAAETNGNLDQYVANSARGGHAVALVGYTKDRFIVRNSWGTSWGDAGFAYASNTYAAAAFTEAYGVTI